MIFLHFIVTYFPHCCLPSLFFSAMPRTDINLLTTKPIIFTLKCDRASSIVNGRARVSEDNCMTFKQDMQKATASSANDVFTPFVFIYFTQDADENWFFLMCSHSF